MTNDKSLQQSIKSLAKTRPRAIVLMYHRVNDLRPDPWTLAVSPANFAEQLEVAQSVGEPTSLRALADMLRTDNLPTKGKIPIVFTFDDGYADNFEFALPLLEKYQIPATVFVTAGLVESKREFWWDEIERIFLQPNVLPENLELIIGQQIYRWKLNKNYSPPEFESDKNWNCVIDENLNPTLRHVIYRELFDLLRLLPNLARDQILSQILIWSQLDDQKEHALNDNYFLCARADRRMMSRHELKTMACSKFVEIAAHTLTHPVLSALTRDEQRSEIADSKKVLEEIIRKPVAGFAYPNGFPADFTLETVEIVSTAGFEYACAAFEALLTAETDVFQLPRVMVRNWCGASFRDALQNYLL